ncbi:hypothetical protein [Amycolatopsis japonica]
MTSLNLLIAKRFGGVRPGLDLLGIEKAAVPVTVVTADVLAQEVKPLPLLDEFVLRLVKAEVGGASEIAAFLGLDQRLVDAAVADHYRESVLSFGPEPGRLALTGRGRRLADELESIRPIQRSFKVAFDRLTWSVADYDGRDLLNKRSALAEGCLLLPAQRTTRIKTADITSAAVNSILRPSGRQVSIDVLDVIDVAPSTHRYMPVDVLIYGDPNRGDVETAVIVDGDPSEDHDVALAKLGGAASLDFRIEPSAPAAALPPHLEGERMPRVLGSPLDIGTPGVREIQLFDHQVVLMTALEKARERLLISADLAVPSVVDSEFFARLEQRLRARVRVDLILAASGKEVDAELDRLAGRYRKWLRVHRPEEVDSNTLLYDGVWAVSEFPWLSFRGAGKPFRDYTGTVVTDSAEADQEYVRQLAPFAS